MNRRLIAAALAVTVIAAACSVNVEDLGDEASTDPDAPVATTEEPSSSSVGDDSVRDYEPVFEATDCWWTLPESQPVECGYLVVPENRADADSPDIRVAVAILRHPGGSPEPDPIINVHGGPGGGPLKIMDLAWSDFAEFFAANRDVIVFDQRGVGFSEPALECPDHASALTDVLDLSVDGQLVTNAEAQSLLLDLLVKCGEQLDSTLDLSAYDSAASAADIDDLRVALGYERVNLYAESYGPRVAQVVMRDFPTGVRSVVLDAPVAMSSQPEDGIVQFGQALRLAFDECAADTSCNAVFPDLGTVWFETLAGLADNPVTLSVTNPLSGEPFDFLLDDAGLATLVWRFSYSTSNVPAIPAMIYAVHDGDYALAEQTLARLPIVLSIFELGDFYNVTCRESSAIASQDVYETTLEQYPEAKAFYEGNLIIPGRGLYTLCDTWGGGTVVESEYEAVASSVPTIVTIGDHDPSQGVDEAEVIAEALENSFGPYVFPGMAHVVYGGSDCSKSIINAFIVDPQTEPDSRCIDDMSLVFAIPGAGDSDVELEPLGGDELGFTTVIPTGWTELIPGGYARGNPAVDPTVLVQASATNESATEAVNEILANLGGSSLPSTPVRAIDSDLLSWSIYLVQGDVMTAVALAENATTSYIVAMRTDAEEFDAFAETLLVPVLMALTPVE